jgi:putative lipase involved disintegration of autophagic bodies
MSYKNMLIVGMALIGALALLTGILVTIPTVLAFEDPNLKSVEVPNQKRYTDPDANRVRILVR